MASEEDVIFRYAQDLFAPGLTTIVGSGASCAYGLPSMADIAKELLARVPEDLTNPSSAEAEVWQRVELALVAGETLEAALGPDQLPQDLGAIITKHVARLVSSSEYAAIARLLATDEPTPLARVLGHALRTNEVADVVTTNYDRLIEAQLAHADIRVDTMYYGHTIGRLDEDLSHSELMRPGTIPGNARHVRLRKWPHIRLAKPHGSLGWFESNDRFYRSELPLPGLEQIIAPGGNKYRLGYEIPFDAQRQRANSAVDRAAALLVVGYGFNDEHLETHLKQRFPHVNVVVLAKSLTANAKKYLETNSSAIGIESADSPEHSVVTRRGSVSYVPLPIWELGGFAKEILGI